MSGSTFWGAFREGQDAREANLQYQEQKQALDANTARANAQADADANPQDTSTTTPASGTSNGGYSPQPAAQSAIPTPTIADPNAPAMGGTPSSSTQPAAITRVGGPVADPSKLAVSPDKLPAAQIDQGTTPTGSTNAGTDTADHDFNSLLRDLAGPANAQSAIPAPQAPQGAVPAAPGGAGAPAQAVPPPPEGGAPNTPMMQGAPPPTQPIPTQPVMAPAPAQQQAQALPGAVSSPPLDVRGFPPQTQAAQTQPLPASASSPPAGISPAIQGSGVPGSAPSLGGRIMAALNPISSASAAELSPAVRNATVDAVTDATGQPRLAPPPGSQTPGQQAAQMTASGQPSALARAATFAAGKGGVDGQSNAASDAQLSMGGDTPDLSSKPAPGSPAAAVKAPPSAAVTGAPAAQGAIPVSGGASVALPSAAAKVAPEQQGPSAQSEAPVTYPKSPLSVIPLAALADQHPQYFDMVNRIAEQYNVSPERLAGHWMNESKMSDASGIVHQNPNGTTDIGPFQINSATLKQIDPNGQLNPDTPEGGAELAARYIKFLDARYGKDTFASVAAYNGGPGAADAILAGQGNPAVINYAKAMFNGKVPSVMQPAMTAPDLNAVVQAVKTQGPNGGIQLIANSNPGVSMGDKWRNVEAASLLAAYNRNDAAGAEQVRDQVLQMQHAGANQNIMGAYAALQTGNGVLAAQMLAKAHAFIADNQMGRFGVDKDGKVWGEMVDEGTGNPSGKAFQVTPQSLGALMVQTKNINTFGQLVQNNQKEQAGIQATLAHGAYLGDLVQARIESGKERLEGVKYAADQRLQGAETGAAARVYAAQQARLTRGAGNPAQLQSAINTELSKPTMTPMVSAVTDPTMNSAARSIYADIRSTGHGVQDADHYVGGLMNGTYRMHQMSVGGTAVLTDGNNQPVFGVDGRQVSISPHAADIAKNALQRLGPSHALPPRGGVRPPANTNPYMSSAYPLTPTVH